MLVRGEMSLISHRQILLYLFLSLSPVVYCQDQAIISGKLTGSDQQPIFLANVAILGTGTGTVTAEDGTFILEVPAGKEFTLIFSCLGYETLTEKLLLTANEKRYLSRSLAIAYQNLDEVSVTEEFDKSGAINRLDLKTLHALPGVAGSVESLLKTLPGVASGNELSSQYSVRGGNFDENLVYVNDIEIYRPFLVRSGQQEGMSFINPHMVSSVKFSAGGFDARYGDKMSSVLDISYRRPSGFGGSLDVSLLGTAFHFEGATKNKRLTHNTGFRYKTTRYLLSSLETKGEYLPSFIDFQTFISYQVSKKIEINFLGNIADNKYNFIPENRSTDFGTYKNPLNLVIYYDGREHDRFDTYLGAFTIHCRPKDNLSLKFINSGFSSLEVERFDIQGQYLINELDNRLDSETFGDSILNIGIGTFLNHARNHLDAWVYSASHIGSWITQNNQLRWGIRYQYEWIGDKMSEWEMVDSAGYSIPYTEAQVLLTSATKSDHILSSRRYIGFLQDTYSFEKNGFKYFINAGIRTNYWDYNGQLLVSPRIILSVNPDWMRNVVLRFSTGFYHQPPFFRELRYRDGTINPEIRAQKSWHIVAGGDYMFTSWDRPFKLSSEIYYKQMHDLIPYKLDNVRIQYAAENIARGYATGIEFKINGEFVKDAESWASLSFMKTAEDITGDLYRDKEGNLIEPGYYPRPTDQRINFGLFFQDYLPHNPDYKMYLTFLYGSRLPFSAPHQDRYDIVFRMPSYKRVDIGFSKIIKKEGSILSDRNPLKYFRSIWISAEIFNLLGVNNTISYLWVKTVSNQENMPGEFAVPNYLTSRRFNLRLTSRF
jgi:hypothetical protein